MKFRPFAANSGRRRFRIFAYYDVLSMIMEKQTISFRLDSDKVAALDSLARALDRDRTYLLGEAIHAFLETQEWQLRQIKAGLAEADRGRVVDHSAVKAMAAKWRHK